MSQLIKHEQCPQCKDNGQDNGKDNLAVYEDGVYCFACGYTTREVDNTFKKGRIVTIESRFLSKESLGKYNVQYFSDGEDRIIFNFYEQGKIEKQKIRVLKDKTDCYQIGNGRSTKLFGQHAFTPSKKICVVVTEGEFDAVAVNQAMGYPAVSIGGAGNALKYLSANIEWLSGFKHVVLCLDNDDAGQKATDVAIGLFEVGKVRVAHMPLKDANDMVMAHREEELKRCIWNAEIMRPSTIVTINDLREKVLKKPAYGIPWNYKPMNDITYGLRPSTIYVVAAAEGIGKTEFIKELMFHLLDNKVNIGVFSFEQDAQDTVQRLIGSKINQRIHLPNCEWWDEEVINKEMDKLDNHLYLYDNRGSLSLDSILLNIRYLVKCCGVKFIVIDNLTAMCADAVIDGKSVSDTIYMGHVANQLHSLVKELKVSMCIVAHVNNDNISKQVYVSTSPKNPEAYMNLKAADVHKMIEKPGLRWETGRIPGLTNIYGSGAIRKLADYIIVLSRNMESEDDDEKRTTIVKFLKCRFDSEKSGSTFNLYYNYSTGRLDTEFNNSPVSLVKLDKDDII